MIWVPIDVIVDTAFRRVVPLYSFDYRDRPYLLGSAVPFQSGDLRFLITAAHCCFREGKAVPLFVYGEKQLHALRELRGVWEYHAGLQPDHDIAVIALEQSCADDLQARHWFCTPEDVAAIAEKTPGVHYLIAGYPASRNKARPVRYGLPGRATALITGDVRSVKCVRGTDKTEELHFALNFPHNKVSTPRGDPFQVPPPRGMSGGGIWRVQIDTGARLVGRPFLVGIAIEYHSEQKTFVATRVQAAAPLAMGLADANTQSTIA